MDFNSNFERKTENIFDTYFTYILHIFALCGTYLHTYFGT